MKKFFTIVWNFLISLFTKKREIKITKSDATGSIFKEGPKKLPKPKTQNLIEGRIWTDLEVIIAYCCTRLELSRIGYTKDFIIECLGRTKGSFNAIQMRLITYEFSQLHVGAPLSSASRLQREVVDDLCRLTQEEIESLFFEALLQFSITEELDIEDFLIESLKGSW